MNLLQVAQTAGLPYNVNSAISTELKAINGVLGQGVLAQSPSDPNLSTFTFTNPSTTTVYYPTVRLDYNATEKLRVNFSYTQNKTSQPFTNAPVFPTIDTVDRTSYKGNNKVVGIGIDYVIRPTLINQFHAGFMYQYSAWDPENSGLDLSTVHQENWSYATSLYSGAYPRTYISSMYPQFTWNDSLSWQRGKHSFVFGGSWFREQDHYWNGPGGFSYWNFGLNSSDPAYNVITSAMPGVSTTLQGNARTLYAVLVGRISGVGLSSPGRPLDMKTKQYKQYGAYNLNEVQQSGGFWAQDRWRVRPNFTVNYGIRWDIVGDDYDKDGAYSSAQSLGDLWGPTPVGAMFRPGVLGGIANPTFTARSHVYNTSWKNPQPAVAIAWNPQASGGILGKLVGTDKTVIRTGYALRNYQEGAQNFWAFASNSGAFFFQSGSASPDPTATGPGYFKPGSLMFGDAAPAYLLNPSTWSPTVSASQMFGSSFYGMNPNIRQPYVQSWNFGIQRELPAGNALEVRYVGNLTLHSWLGLNINEANIFENNFLPEFKNAQSNLAINQANGKGNTAVNNGLPGQVALPIETAAFAGNAAGWTAFLTPLQTGAAGSMARTLLSTTSYLCNLIGGANFSPCAGYAGAGYPVNFWNINPYPKTSGINYLDSAGTSNYHALQVEFRQRLTHGMQFNLNYTWAHSLGLAAVNNLQSQGLAINTVRNLRLSYGPSTFDIRHVFHASGTYDLPFGNGKRFLNSGRLLDSVFGHWTLGMVTIAQTGNPATISGGYATVTGVDSGVNLIGISAKDFQNGISIRKGGAPYVTTFDPKYIGANGMANPTYITQASTPGVFGYRPVFWAPMWWNTDLSINKSIPIRERVKMTLQATGSNAFNHPTFGIGSLSITSTSFGQTTTGSARNIELRANIEF